MFKDTRHSTDLLNKLFLYIITRGKNFFPFSEKLIFESYGIVSTRSYVFSELMPTGEYFSKSENST